MHHRQSNSAFCIIYVICMVVPATAPQPLHHMHCPGRPAAWQHQLLAGSAKPLGEDFVVLAVIVQLLQGIINLLQKLFVLLGYGNAVVLGGQEIRQCLWCSGWQNHANYISNAKCTVALAMVHFYFVDTSALVSYNMLVILF